MKKHNITAKETGSVFWVFKKRNAEGLEAAQKTVIECYSTKLI